MNCLDLRRAYITDPYRLSTEQREHLEHCEACTRYVQRQAEFDLRLEQAMNMPVPERLDSQVIFEHSFRGRRWRKWFAAAAVWVLAVGAALTIFLSSPQTAVAEQMIAHMGHDPLHEMPAAEDAVATLNEVNGRSRISLQPTALERRIVRAKLCIVDGQEGLHLVLENSDGTRITAFVVPSQMDVQTAWFQAESQQGMLLSTRQGVIAVFCPKSVDRAQLLALGEQLERTVRWPS